MKLSLPVFGEDMSMIAMFEAVFFSLMIIKCSFLFFLIRFGLKSILSDIRIATPARLPWSIISHPFIPLISAINLTPSPVN